MGPGLKYDFEGVPGNARSSNAVGVCAGVEAAEDVPSRAERVISRALGIILEKKGDMGLERRVAQMDPHMVRKVRRRVAKTGEKSAPASTFQMTEPGIDQACFQTAVMAMTATTCHISQCPLCEYVCKSLPSRARSVNVRGHEKDMGNELSESSTIPVDSGMSMITNRIGLARKLDGCVGGGCSFSVKSNAVFVAGEDRGSIGFSSVGLGWRCSHCRKRDATKVIMLESGASVYALVSSGKGDSVRGDSDSDSGWRFWLEQRRPKV